MIVVSECTLTEFVQKAMEFAKSQDKKFFLYDNGNNKWTLDTECKDDHIGMVFVGGKDLLIEEPYCSMLKETA